MADVFQLFRKDHYISEAGMYLSGCDLAEDAEHGHPHYTLDDIAGRWSRSMRANKKNFWRMRTWTQQAQYIPAQRKLQARGTLLRFQAVWAS